MWPSAREATCTWPIRPTCGFSIGTSSAAIRVNGPSPWPAPTAVLTWPDAVEKAKRAETFVRELLKIEGLEPRDIHFGYVGINSLMGPGAPWPDYEMNEVGLRVAMKVNTREEARIARLVISMLWGGGVIGTSLLGNSLSDRAVIGLWPTLIPRAEVPTTLTMMEVK